MKVYKILTDSEWNKFQLEKESRGTDLDRKDGFIHLCNRDQALGVIERYFQGREVITLELVNPELIEQIKWELATNNEHFPHLYVEKISLHDFQVCQIQS